MVGKLKKKEADMPDDKDGKAEAAAAEGQPDDMHAAPSEEPDPTDIDEPDEDTEILHGQEAKALAAASRRALSRKLADDSSTNDADVRPSVIVEDEHHEPAAYKAWSPDSLVTDFEKRQIKSVISTTTVDDIGDVMIPKGAKRNLARYRKNPVVWFGHDYSGLPIGNNLWPLKFTDTEIIGLTQLRPEGHSQMADDLLLYLQAGFTLGVSIGYDIMPDGAHAPTEKELAKHPEWVGARQIVDDWELWEYSYTGMPMNPDSLAKALHKGKITVPVLQRLGIKEPEAEAEPVPIMVVRRGLVEGPVTRCEIPPRKKVLTRKVVRCIVDVRMDDAAQEIDSIIRRVTGYVDD